MEVVPQSAHSIVTARSSELRASSPNLSRSVASCAPAVIAKSRNRSSPTPLIISVCSVECLVGRCFTTHSRWRPTGSWGTPRKDTMSLRVAPSFCRLFAGPRSCVGRAKMGRVGADGCFRHKCLFNNSLSHPSSAGPSGKGHSCAQNGPSGPSGSVTSTSPYPKASCVRGPLGPLQLGGKGMGRVARSVFQDDARGAFAGPAWPQGTGQGGSLVPHAQELA
jgi:hypothetical protein